MLCMEMIDYIENSYFSVCYFRFDCCISLDREVVRTLVLCETFLVASERRTLCFRKTPILEMGVLEPSNSIFTDTKTQLSF